MTMELNIKGLKVDAGSGAGSRGGHVIGHTSGGKPIYIRAGHPQHASFTAGEHAEASKKHFDLAEKAKYNAGAAKNPSDASERAHHEKRAKIHLAQAGAHEGMGEKLKKQAKKGA